MSKNMKCNKQYVFHMLHFYYDRQEHDQESYKYNTKTKYRLKIE